MTRQGKLFLLPAPLGEGALEHIPANVIQVLHRLDHLIVEKAKTARHYIKSTNPPKPIPSYIIQELNEHTSKEQIFSLLKPALSGKDMGLMSEAGCPGVADPGAELVLHAHRNGIEVVPFTGPSSIFLALMASGMNGQSFCFHGYLSPRPQELVKDLRHLESLSVKNRQTQIFIETPYRNKNVLAQALTTLSPDTLFCIAADITLADQFVKTKSIQEWQKVQLPDLHKRPTVFLIYRQ